MKYAAIATLVMAITVVTACGALPTKNNTPVEMDESLPTATAIPPSTSTPALPPTETPTSAPTATPVAVETPQPVITPASESAEQKPQLTMVLIQASASEVQQLRKMPLEIVRVIPIKANSTPTTKADFLESQFRVEAVVPTDLLVKLKNLGFDVTEVP